MDEAENGKQPAHYDTCGQHIESHVSVRVLAWASIKCAKMLRCQVHDGYTILFHGVA